MATQKNTKKSYRKSTTPRWAPKNTVLGILQRALRTLSNPLRWTQGCLAKDVNGFGVKPNNPNAVRFCALGACSHVMGIGYYPEVPSYNGGGGQVGKAVLDLLNEAASEVGHTGRSVVDFNDSTASHGDILKIFRLAIKKARAAGL